MVTLSQNDAVGAAAVLPSAQTGERFGIPVLPRFGDYLLAAQNRQAGAVICRIELLDESGVVVAERSHNFAGTTSVVRYLSDLASAPAAFAGGSATVTCDRQIAVTGLLAGSALSGLPPAVLPGVRTGAGFAPVDSAAFDRLVVGKRVVSVDDSRSYIEFPAAGQFVDVEPGVRYTGTYTYVNTGPDTGNGDGQLWKWRYLHQRINLYFRHYGFNPVRLYQRRDRRRKFSAGQFTALDRRRRRRRRQYGNSDVPRQRPVRSGRFDGGG